MIARDAVTGRFILADPPRVPVWTEPPTVTPELRAWITATADTLWASVLDKQGPLPQFTVDTGLCLRAIEQVDGDTTWHLSCTRPAKHPGKCAPLDRQDRDVLEVVAAAEPQPEHTHNGDSS